MKTPEEFIRDNYGKHLLKDDAKWDLEQVIEAMKDWNNYVSVQPKWIPVSEKLPTFQDAYNGDVLGKNLDGIKQTFYTDIQPNKFTHWMQISSL